MERISLFQYLLVLANTKLSCEFGLSCGVALMVLSNLCCLAASQLLGSACLGILLAAGRDPGGS